MLTRLNGWQRIGTALSVLWLAFALLVGINAYGQMASGGGPFVDTIKGEAQTFVAGPEANDGTGTFTFEEATSGTGTYLPGTPDRHDFKFGVFCAFALGPPIAAWLLTYLFLAVVRWVVLGFKQNPT